VCACYLGQRDLRETGPTSATDDDLASTAGVPDPVQHRVKVPMLERPSAADAHEAVELIAIHTIIAVHRGGCR
jgi:hypothetical protein